MAGDRIKKVTKPLKNKEKILLDIIDILKAFLGNFLCF